MLSLRHDETTRLKGPVNRLTPAAAPGSNLEFLRLAAKKCEELLPPSEQLADPPAPTARGPLTFGEAMKLTIKFVSKPCLRSGLRPVQGNRLSLASALRARLITRKEAEEQLAVKRSF